MTGVHCSLCPAHVAGVDEFLEHIRTAHPADFAALPGQGSPVTHTPADPGADECADDAAGEFERDLRMDGDL